MADTQASNVLTRIQRLEQASRDEVETRIADVFRDGVVVRAEAEALIQLTPRYTGNVPSWNARMIEAVCDYLLEQESPHRWITDSEADWLIALIMARPGESLIADIDLLLTLVRKAEGAPPRLGLLALELVCKRIMTLGQALEEDVERVRSAVYAQSSEGGLWVTRKEANLLFQTNDAIAKADNASAWNDLFARTIGNHLLAAAHPDPITEMDALAREEWLKRPEGGVLRHLAGVFSSGKWFDRLTYDPKKAAAARQAAKDAAIRAGKDVTAGESDWFLQRLRWDGDVSPAERALIDFLKREAPGFANGLFVAA
ncbi:MAG: hypothetical protein MRY64_11750 [Hyphomonadaceae bacterium]|nr:hypothetical protein [Hyphomonadaceae bacterium]